MDPMLRKASIISAFRWMTLTPFGLSGSKWELGRESTSGRKAERPSFVFTIPTTAPVDLSKHGSLI